MAAQANAGLSLSRHIRHIQLEVELKHVRQYGLNPFSFPQPVGKEERSCTYEAEFIPEWYEDASGARIVGKPPGDRAENNKASAHVVASGRRYVLILEGKEKYNREAPKEDVEKLNLLKGHVRKGQFVTKLRKVFAKDEMSDDLEFVRANRIRHRMGAGEIEEGLGVLRVAIDDLLQVLQEPLDGHSFELDRGEFRRRGRGEGQDREYYEDRSHKV